MTAPEAAPRPALADAEAEGSAAVLAQAKAVEDRNLHVALEKILFECCPDLDSSQTWPLARDLMERGVTLRLLAQQQPAPAPAEAPEIEGMRAALARHMPTHSPYIFGPAESQEAWLRGWQAVRTELDWWRDLGAQEDRAALATAEAGAE